MQSNNALSFFLLDVIGVLVSECIVLCFQALNFITLPFYIITSCLN